MICDVYGLRSPPCQSRIVLHVTPINVASMQTLVLQGLEERLQKLCTLCKQDTWHTYSKYMLQPSTKYRIIIVNRISCIENQFTVPLDQTRMFGSCEFTLQLSYHNP